MAANNPKLLSYIKQKKVDFIIIVKEYLFAKLKLL